MGTRKRYSRKLAAILTVLAMVLALFPVAAFAQEQPTFKDIAGLKLQAEIEAAAKAGIVSGYPDGTFRPKENVTRAQFAKMVVLAVEKATGKTLEKGEPNFKDVNPKQTLYEYVAKAAKAGYIQGYEDGTFGYDKPIVREEAAAILQRALGLQEAEENFDDVTSDMRLAGAIGAVAKAGIMKGFDEKTFGPRETVTRDQAAATAVRGFNYLVEKNAKYEVVSVTAVSSKALRVTFNKAVEDTSAVKFDVKRDGVAVSLTAKWAEDKKSVDLESSSKLQPGTYTVTVTGLDFAEGKNTGSVKVEEEKVAKIELLGDKLIRSKTDTTIATIPFRVLNQYGEDVTKTSLAADIAWSASTGQASVDQPGVLTVKLDSGWAIDQKVVVTGVDRTTGVTVSKTLTVAEAGVLGSFSFGKVLYPDNVDRLYVGRERAGWIEVNATDPNGNPVTADYLKTAIQLVASSGVVAEVDVKDGKPVVALDTRSAIEGKATITAVVLATPELNKSITVDIVAEPYAAKVDVGVLDGVVAAGDDRYTLVLPVTVYDQFGKQLSAEEIADQRRAGNLQVAVAGVEELQGKIDIATDGEHIGKVVNTDAIPASAAGKYVTVTVTATKSGSTDYARILVREQRQPAALVMPSDASTNLLVGATSTIALGFKDQYDASYKPDGSETGYEFKVTVRNLNVVNVKVGGSSGTAVVDDDGDQTANEPEDQDKIGTLTISPADLSVVRNIWVEGLAAGSGYVTVELIKVEGSNRKTVDQVSFTITVAQASSQLQYSIAEIPPLYWNGNGGAFGEAIKVIAKDASGKSYVVPASRIIGYSVSSSDFAVTSGKVYSTLTERPQSDVKGTVTVVFLREDGKMVTLDAPVTISAAERQPVAVHIRNSSMDGLPAKELPSGSTSVSSAEVTLSSGAGDIPAYVAFEDQFGWFWVPDNATSDATDDYTIIVANASSGLQVNSSNVTIDSTSGQLKLTGVTGTGTFDLLILSRNGKSASLKVTVK